jgi:hypothetical protein
MLLSLSNSDAEFTGVYDVSCEDDEDEEGVSVDDEDMGESDGGCDTDAMIREDDLIK